MPTVGQKLICTAHKPCPLWVKSRQFRSAIAMSALPPTAVRAPHLARTAHWPCNRGKFLPLSSVYESRRVHTAHQCASHVLPSLGRGHHEAQQDHRFSDPSTGWEGRTLRV